MTNTDVGLRVTILQVTDPIWPTYNTADRRTEGRTDNLREQYRALHRAHRAVNTGSESAPDHPQNKIKCRFLKCIYNDVSNFFYKHIYRYKPKSTWS